MISADVPRPDRAQAGFTLIELLVVMVIVSVLAALAIPRLLGTRDRAHDTAALSIARNALTAEVAFVLDNPDEGYMDLWQNSAQRQQYIAQIEASAVWYDGWSGSAPAVGQVMVRAGHINSQSWVDDWVIMTVLSRSGTCLSISREDTPPPTSAGLAVGTFYWRGQSSNGVCPATPNGNLPPSAAPSGPPTAAQWGSRF